MQWFNRISFESNGVWRGQNPQLVRNDIFSPYPLAVCEPGVASAVKHFLCLRGPAATVVHEFPENIFNPILHAKVRCDALSNMLSQHSHPHLPDRPWYNLIHHVRFKWNLTTHFCHHHAVLKRAFSITCLDNFTLKTQAFFLFDSYVRLSTICICLHPLGAFCSVAVCIQQSSDRLDISKPSYDFTLLEHGRI